jgi:hypothetical protein
MGGMAVAGTKLRIAVLGLEVSDPNGAPTPGDAQVAKELTEALRNRAKSGTSPYEIQPGSEKELLDEKILKSCDNEAVGCMAQIGGDLGSDLLIYGAIAKKGAAYEVTINLLDVRNKQVKPNHATIPSAQAQGPALQGWAKKIYNGLTGQADSGQITVRITNVGELRGSIKVDGEDKGTINSSTGSASGVAPGKHTLTVVVGGYKPKDSTITVVEGQTANVPVELEKDEGEPLPPGPPPPGPTHHEVQRGEGTWKAVAIGSFAVAAIGAGVWIYGYSQIGTANTRLRELGSQCSDGSTPSKNGGACPDGSVAMNTSGLSGSALRDAVGKANKNGDDGRAMTIGGIATVAVALIPLGFGVYKGFIAKGSTSSTEHADGRRVRRDRFVVTPVITPNGGGASLQFDW